MQLTSRNGVAITSLADWSTLGKPAATEHWKPGRSAYELARDWTEDDAAHAVIDLLSARPEFAGVEIVDGVVEKRTQFDGDSRGPRNHDLLLRCRLPDGQCLTVGVEGKADEPFDLPLWRYREQALRRSPNTQALVRVDAMIRRWFGISLAADRGDPLLIGIGYQLFSALAGTLADAKLDGSGQAVVLIAEYITRPHGRRSTRLQRAHVGRVLVASDWSVRSAELSGERVDH